MHLKYTLGAQYRHIGTMCLGLILMKKTKNDKNIYNIIFNAC